MLLSCSSNACLCLCRASSSALEVFPSARFCDSVGSVRTGGGYEMVAGKFGFEEYSEGVEASEVSLILDAEADGDLGSAAVTWLNVTPLRIRVDLKSMPRRRFH